MNIFLFLCIYLNGDTMINGKLIFKGMIIGLAKIVPGVSGSMLAVSLGIYALAIEAISHPFRNFKYNICFLGNVGIGVLFSITLCSNIVSFFLSKYFFITLLLCIGFILGTFPALFKEVQIETGKDYFFVAFIAMLIFGLLCFRNPTLFIYKNTFANNLYVLLLGFIDAATMVIPGISGTAIFLLLGTYSFVLELFSSLSSFSNLLSNIIPILFFSLGLLMGVIFVSKIMNYALHYKKKSTYLCILGFALSSILLLCIDLLPRFSSLAELLLGSILFIIGYKVSVRLNV